jgi:copper chaperone CopZ
MSAAKCFPPLLMLIVALAGISISGSASAQPFEAPSPQFEDPSPVVVNLSGAHLCCKACVKAFMDAATIDGVQAELKEGQDMVVLTAADYRDVQQALDHLAKAGFSSRIEDATQTGKIAFPEIKTPDDNVKKLAVRHIHNCCAGCSEAIIAAIESVDGVKSQTVKPKVESFVVEGDFDAGEVVQALLDAGFYPTLQ